MAKVFTDYDPRDVASRWTTDLIRAGWTPVSDFFLSHYRRLPSPLTTPEAMFVIQLMTFKWSRSSPYPSFKRIAARMGVTPTAVRNYARSLERKGYLRRVIRRGTTNRFDLTGLFTHLELLQREMIERKKAEALESQSVEERLAALAVSPF